MILQSLISFQPRAAQSGRQNHLGLIGGQRASTVCLAPALASARHSKGRDGGRACSPMAHAAPGQNPAAKVSEELGTSISQSPPISILPALLAGYFVLTAKTPSLGEKAKEKRVIK